MEENNNRLVLSNPSNYTLGKIRLVNPWRGLCYCANMNNSHGIISARTFDFKIFGIHVIVEQEEFYCGREFSRAELAQWLLGEYMPPDQRQVIADEFGDIPAIAPDPQAWGWYSVYGRGEDKLKQKTEPTVRELQQLAGAALLLNRDRFLPLLDPYEIWVCHRESKNPLALVFCDINLDRLDWQTFSSWWRADIYNDTMSSEKFSQSIKLEKSINERINIAVNPGIFSFVHRLFKKNPGSFSCCLRLFKRNLDGSSIEYTKLDPNDLTQPIIKIAEHKAGFLPDGVLAEPWESKRLRLLNSR